MDVHGAGAQRSDPKTGRPTSRGPQGDMIRVNNYVRCVRGGSVKIRTSTPSEDKSKYPYNLKVYRGVSQEGQRGSEGISRPRFGGRGFVERLDRYGDGKISRSEFDGPKDRFDYHDRNYDGYLTEDEAPKGPPPGGGRLSVRTSKTNRPFRLTSRLLATLNSDPDPQRSVSIEKWCCIIGLQTVYSMYIQSDIF